MGEKWYGQDGSGMDGTERYGLDGVELVGKSLDETQRLGWRRCNGKAWVEEEMDRKQLGRVEFEKIYRSVVSRKDIN